jgi:Reverse transcriptase (RNA-dependent DNA polymerase)
VVSEVGSSILLQALSCLFNKSLSTSTVLIQWKKAGIQPVQKISTPKERADSRPISVTPVSTRIIERTKVTSFLYPALLSPATDMQVLDQFAFRSTGSTTAALVSLMHKITHHLVTEPFVIVLALDFSKAFDTVQHSTLMEKLAQLDSPDHVHNGWLTFLPFIYTVTNIEVSLNFV